LAKKELDLVRRRFAGLLLTIFVVGGLFAAYLFLAPLYPRHAYLSGWIFLAVMLFLTFFNFRKKVPFLRMGSVGFWLQVHIYVGIISGALFFVHIGFSWPHGLLNQIIAVIFAIVFVSGVIGLWISRSFPKRLTVAGFETPFERMPHVRTSLRKEAEALLLAGVDNQTSPVIAEFFTDRIGLFFAKPRNLAAHLLRSQSPLASHRSQFGEIRRYAKRTELDMLGKLEDLVERKHMLDYQYALQLTLRVWLFAHIPLSYSLLILSVAHVVVVYSFSGSAP
jgi:hypothetical protein